VDYTFNLKLQKIVEEMIVSKMMKDAVIIIKNEKLKDLELVFDWFKNLLRT